MIEDELPFHNVNDLELQSECQSSLIISPPLSEFENKIFMPFDSDHDTLSDDHSDYVFNSLNGFGVSNHHFVNDFQQMLKTSNKNSCMLFNNIRSIPANFDSYFLQNIQTNIDKVFSMSFCETRLDQSIQNLYKKDNFSLFTNNNTTNMGGIACYVKSGFKCRIIKQCTIMLESFESLFLEVDLLDKTIILGTIYRRPGTDIDVFMSNLRLVLEYLKSRNLKAYISGDFNLDLAKYNTKEIVKNYADTLFHNYFYPCTHKVTRVFNNSATIIDSIWTNDMNSKKTNGILLTDNSDHFTLFLLFDSIDNSVQSTPKTITYRDLNHTSDEDVKLLIQNKMNSIHISDNVDKPFEDLCIALKQISEEAYPLKSITLKNKSTSKPWISQYTTTLIKQRHNLYKKYIKWPITYGHEYRTLRNTVNYRIRDEKEKYFRNKLENAVGNSKKIWKVVGQILNNKTNRSHYINKLKVDNIVIENGDEISNEFNKFFTSIGKNITSTLPQSDRSPADYLEGDFPSINKFKHTNINEVKEIIKNIKTNSIGIDGIHPKIIKVGAEELAPTLTMLINNCFDKGLFPDVLKVAKVIPIFKNGEECDPANYRPISILPILSKIVERLIYNRMLEHLNINSIITDKQFGFIKGLSTESAIIKMLNNLISDLDKGKHVIGLFLDLSKAFDVISHEILTLKLKHYGFQSDTLALLKSYLSNRFQYSYVNEKLSQKLKIEQGVPQGSILGPLLFNTFINDLVNVSNVLSYLLYADDSNMFHTDHNMQNLVSEMNTELRKISEWFIVNQLVINMDKTHFVIFSRKRIHDDVTLFLNGVRLKEKKITKFLGIFIDNKLNWSEHIINVVMKINMNIGIIWKIRNSIDKKTKIPFI